MKNTCIPVNHKHTGCTRKRFPAERPTKPVKDGEKQEDVGLDEEKGWK